MSSKDSHRIELLRRLIRNFTVNPCPTLANSVDPDQWASEEAH